MTRRPAAVRSSAAGMAGWGTPARTGRAASGHHNRRPFAPYTAGSPVWPAGTPARLGCRPASAGFGWLNAESGAGPRHVTRGHPVSHQRCVAPDAPRQPRRRRRHDQRSVAVNSPAILAPSDPPGRSGPARAGRTLAYARRPATWAGHQGRPCPESASQPRQRTPRSPAPRTLRPPRAASSAPPPMLGHRVRRRPRGREETSQRGSITIWPDRCLTMSG